MPYGIEIENYDSKMLRERGGHTDGQNISEIPSPKFEKLKEVISWFEEMRKKYDFIYHSYPEIKDFEKKSCVNDYITCGDCGGNGCEECGGHGRIQCDTDDCEGCENFQTMRDCDTCSLHMHISPFITHENYLKMYRFLGNFSFLFANSPKINDNNDVILSNRRYTHSSWCIRRRLHEGEWEEVVKHHIAITPTSIGSERHIEFRYPDFPRHPNQMVFFPYLMFLIQKYGFPSRLKRHEDIITLESLKGVKGNIYENCEQLNKFYGKIKFWDFSTKSFELIGNILKKFYDTTIADYSEYMKNPKDEEWSKKFGAEWSATMPTGELWRDEVEIKQWEDFFKNVMENNPEMV